ncbi:nadh ubiquinone oxidoreductase 20 kd subunit [Lucifera butyrica]|uniref:Nadh ubiquinone oxidoreductase 20 kd subunit n=1 Tax=Lucifera butyrica TaxID=1351585 RepID=A0A498RFG4_9FIRM|nr:4Fe-4S binding protein [Lucifera butyrica]VBB09755.1 nadh ubiquinone oxidoreductase 20 kd subunit [Lucifera butyrica]
MWAKWLRSGIASGRSTVSYPAGKNISGEHAGWQRIPVSTGPCGECRTCRDVCPAGAIQEKTAETGTININSDNCIGCGVCMEVCPQGVLSPGRLDRADRTDIGNAKAPVEEILREKTAVKGLLPLFNRSLHVRHIDTGSCNACESEIAALSNPYYNFHRLGIFFTASPRHADVLLVTGAVTLPMRPVLLEAYEAMPRPRIVIATGVCALSGGLFKNSERFAGPVTDFLPVDVKIPGCPPNPYALLNGLLTAVKQNGRAV